MAKSRRTYTRNFKVGAVRRIAEQGKGLVEVDLGEGLLRSWKAALTADGERTFPGKCALPVVDEEPRQLRVENHRLRLGREILKEATVFFAGESW